MKTKYIGIAAAISLTAITVCGCGEKEKDYDVYFFNGKSEIAESLETVADEYEAETGKKVKVFTVGTSESSETLRSEIKSKAYPTVFASNAIGIEEWKSAGFAMDASKIHNPQLKALYESVPDSMKLEFEGEGNYGIPYNIEGYGLIANKKMLTEILQIDDINQFKQDYKEASYTEFQDMIKSLDSYIKNNSGEDFTLNGQIYHIRNGKTSYTESLTGVLSIAGAEKWTYGNHYGNFPISAVYNTVYDVRESEPEKAERLKEPIIKSLKELEFATNYAAGANSPIERGSQFINSTATGYDQAIQMLAEKKAIFMKNGNWIYSNVQKISEETAENLIMLPVKVSFDENDITADGMTLEKMNRSIPEFVSQYYVINAKATEEEQRDAEDFVYWLNTSEKGLDFIVNDFAFVPFNADENTQLDNPLSNDLIEYKLADDLLANPFDAAPASWGLESYGKYVMEELFVQKENWPDAQLTKIADKCIKDWKSGMEEW